MDLLSDDIRRDPYPTYERLRTVAPVLLMPGSVQTTGAADADSRYVGRVTVFGVDDRFKPTDRPGIDWGGDARSVVLSYRVTERLLVRAGDKVKLGLQRFSDLPRSSLLAKRSASSTGSSRRGKPASRRSRGRRSRSRPVSSAAWIASSVAASPMRKPLAAVRRRLLRCAPQPRARPRSPRN